MTRTILLPALAGLALALALPDAASAQGRACPPGLAKKNPPCVPPGQARHLRVGDVYDGPWSSADWWRYGLPRPRSGETWVRVGDDVIVRVDEGTRAILQIVALAGAVLSN